MKIDKQAPDAAVKFASEALFLCDWIDTTNLVFIGGRGVAKSTVIPGAPNDVSALCPALLWLLWRTLIQTLSTI